MRYISTRGQGEPLKFTETILTGLARDGGLFIPETFPQVGDRLESWSRLNYRDLAFEIMSLYADDIPPAELKTIIDRSYRVFRDPETTPVRPLGDLWLLELFHGPTYAFKDIALQFLGNLFEYVLARDGRQMNIIAATSGDTGSAAIQGVRGRKGIEIFVMHPHGRVSPVQERQMTTVLDPNVHNLAVKGTFDDCQSIVKSLFGDLPFRDRNHLGAVNSINWARVLAQVVYYFYAGLKVLRTTGAKRLRITVPTGNFGDIFAGYVAAKMGLPVERLVAATNENDILARYFQSGTYSLGQVAPTLSPSMDIQVASNFERYLYFLAQKNAPKLVQWMETFKATGSLTPGVADDPILTGGRGDTADTLRTIREAWETHQVLLDPHTAVGVAVARRNLSPDAAMVTLATAHPAKFPDAIRQATGEDLAHIPELDALAAKPVRCDLIEPSPQAVGGYLEAAISR